MGGGQVLRGHEVEAAHRLSKRYTHAGTTMHVVSTFSPSPAIRLPLSLTSVCLCTCTRFHHLSLRHVLYTPTPLSPPFAISSRPTLCFLRLSSFVELLFLFSLHLLFNAVAPAHLFVFPVQKCLCMCVLFYFFFCNDILLDLMKIKRFLLHCSSFNRV